jgi:septal ring factor EnvC (AmiA/AmiB activator)
MRNLSFKNLLLGMIFLLSFQQTFAQSEQQKELEKRRQEILKEISQINSFLFSNKKETQSVLQQVQSLDIKIKARQKLIDITNQQANLLNRDIRRNEQKIKDLTYELSLLKSDYADMIRKAYKSKSDQSRLMFLLSSDNFLQAYKRLQYMKQYTNYRKTQGIEIQDKTVELNKVNEDLAKQVAVKEVLIKENLDAQALLLTEKKEQEGLVKNLRKKERSFANEIKKKQQEVDRIDKQIQKLIRDAIAASNKASGNTGSAKFSLTPEAKILADNFVSNKGNLPWPIEKGLLVLGFGKQPHPYVKNVFINSNGVRIATEEGAKARAIFEGEVLEIQVISGANKNVLIQHGNYISVYSNLGKVYVKKGEKIKIYQEIGEVFTNKSTNETVLKFSIFRDSDPQNPADWIYRM